MLMKENLMYIEKENIKIIQNSGKYGLMSDSEVVLPAEYDNIFLYGRYLYVLHKGGKIGALDLKTKICLTEPLRKRNMTHLIFTGMTCFFQTAMNLCTISMMRKNTNSRAPIHLQIYPLKSE